MAVVFTKLPGAKGRRLENAVPGLRRNSGTFSGMRRPLTGAALKLEQSRKKCGRFLSWVSLISSVVFFTAVLVRLVFQGSWTDLDSTIFAFIWGITACTVHLVVFIAEALSGSDSPKSVLGVVIFWFGMVVLWVM